MPHTTGTTADTLKTNRIGYTKRLSSSNAAARSYYLLLHLASAPQPWRLVLANGKVQDLTTAKATWTPKSLLQSQLREELHSVK